MKIKFHIAWDKGRKYFSIINYKEAWLSNGITPRFHFRTNGARKRKGDRCKDVTLELGYIVLNYTNFNLQNNK